MKDACQNLPENQRLTVEACFEAAKHKDSRGIRYTTQWIYECLLLRIKSPKAYRHLRDKKMLSLPSITTLNRYLRKIRGAYGFHEETFTLLKEKTAHMKPEEVRGAYIATYTFYSLLIHYTNAYTCTAHKNTHTCIHARARAITCTHTRCTVSIDRKLIALVAYI